MARKIELTWVCSSCDFRNLGRHKECQQCGNPKDASEKYEMPGETRAVASVTDEKLLRQASAGRDWRCKYCGSNQMRLDHRCAQCGADAGEGAAVHDGPAPPRPTANSALRVTRPFPVAARAGALVAAVVGVLFTCAGSCVGLGALSSWWNHRPRDVQVAGTSWEHVVHVDCYRVFDREGFAEARPAAAFDVRPLGQRHHHDEQVFNHMETVHYTERVQDGYDTESYTERVSCGQDCTSTPESCHEVCTSDDNGFASCHDVCSGGGQSCSTRYCDESRTRQVPRYRDDPRTREEPRYRPEPRFAEWFAYKVWDWGENRVLRQAGLNDAAHWPTTEAIHLGVGLAEGERERERRDARYTVRFADADGGSYALVPSSEAGFRRFPIGSRHRIRANGPQVEAVLAPGE